MKTNLSVWLSVAGLFVFQGLSGTLYAQEDSRAGDIAGVVSETASQFQPEDVFASASSCRIVDGYAIRPYSLKEAAKALASCLKELSGRYKIPVSAAVGTPMNGTSMGIEVEMLLLKLPASVTVADSFYRSLNYSLSLRHRMLLGHPAQITRTVDNAQIEIASAR